MNKIKIFLPVFLLVVVGMLALSSCEKEEELLEKKAENTEKETISTIESYENLTVADMPQLEVRDGMLYFANSEQYFKTIAIVGKMTDEQLDQWEQKLGFVSLRTIQNKALEELNALETEDELYSFIKKHDDLFEITTDENGEQEMNLRIDGIVFNKITNKNSMYLIGSEINKITKNYIISSSLKNANIYKLSILKDRNVFKLKNDEKLSISKYTIDKSKSNCGVDNRGSAQKGNKKVVIRFYMENVNTHPIYDIRVSVKVKGYKRIGFTWFPYRTNLTHFGSTIDVRFPKSSSSYSNITLNFREVNSSNSYEIHQMTRIAYFYYNGSSHLDWYFNSYIGSASSRGVGHNVVTLSCN